MKISDQKQLEIDTLPSREYEAYRDPLKYFRDYNNVIRTAREEGWKEGYEEGIKEAKLAMAKKMLDYGLTIEFTADITDLSIEQLQKIKR
jgi:predicted transposase/invertase (TIGR01784 family)